MLPQAQESTFSQSLRSIVSPPASTRFCESATPVGADEKHQVRTPRTPWNASVFGDIATILELSWLAIAVALAHVVCGQLAGQSTVLDTIALLAAAGFAPLLAQPIYRLVGADGSNMWRDAKVGALRAAGAVGVAVLALGTVGVMTGVSEEYSTTWFATWAVVSILGVVVIRFAAALVWRYAEANRRFVQRIAVYSPFGPSGLSTTQIQELIAQHGMGQKDVTRYGRTEEHGAPSRHEDEWARDELLRLIDDGQTTPFDTVVVVTPKRIRARLPGILDDLAVLPAELLLARPTARTAPDIGQPAALPAGISTEPSVLVHTIQAKPLPRHAGWLKWALDKVGAVFALALFAPIMLACAIAIKLDSRGPVFFRQRRHGLNHAIIDVWKFRTMSVMEDGENVTQAKRGDQRVTRVGRVLRKTSLDELPQLFNVIRGEMSLVGPRPHALAHNAQYARLFRTYARRHRVKPGITGWAQINGFRGPTEDPELMHRRAILDNEYIDNWSLFTDLRILMLTPIFGFMSRNAL